MACLRRYAGICFALLCLVAFVSIVPALYVRPRQAVAVEMQVALPRFVQVVMAAGDRYLAANLAGFRTLVASTEHMGPENFRIQALVQADTAWLNPAHEDNYYLAAALLPWNNQLAAAQEILLAATKARSFDWLPPFYYGFDLLHFMKRPAEGAHWLRVAAEHTTDELQRLQLQQMAANWLASGEDVDLAIRVHRAMARETKHKAFAAFLEKRAVRLENLLALDKAIELYQQQLSVMPQDLRQIVAKGIISELPVDPFGASYTMDKAGRPRAAVLENNRSGR